jgi:hypothetical protein
MRLWDCACVPLRHYWNSWKSCIGSSEAAAAATAVEQRAGDGGKEGEASQQPPGAALAQMAGGRQQGSACTRPGSGQLRGQLTELHRTMRERQEAMTAAMATTSMNEPMTYMSWSLPPVGLNTCTA